MFGPKSRDGNRKCVQFVIAKRRGVTALGHKFKKGDEILHLSSERSTGEAFMLTRAEVMKVLAGKPKLRWKSAHPSRPKRKRERAKFPDIRTA